MPRAYIMFIFSIAPQLTTGTNTICASQSNIEITGSNPDQTSTKQLFSAITYVVIEVRAYNLSNLDFNPKHVFALTGN